MTRAVTPLCKACLSILLFFVPLVSAGLLLAPGSASAQMEIDGPPTPASRALTLWLPQHIPAKFQARGKFEVRMLSNTAMEAYLSASDTSSENSAENSTDDDNEIDGVFVNDPPQIVLRVAGKGPLDYDTFAHEYGHYVWFDLLTKDDRKHYRQIYEKQKAAHKLISDYAYDSIEEGFAEAFSTDINAPSALLHQDPLSQQFLSRWAAAPPSP